MEVLARPARGAALLSILVISLSPLHTTERNAVGAAPAPLEYPVKAAFIYNFAKFVDWPTGSFSESRQGFAVCLLGEDPFGGSLERTFLDKTVSGAKVIVRHSAGPSQVEGCQILFVGAAEDPTLAQLMERIRNLPVLTIGETERFEKMGGIVRFLLEENKVRFEINTDAAKRSKLRISAKLLALAKVIGDRDREE